MVGSATSYSYFPLKDVSDSKIFAAGKETVLVSSLQARNNARVVFVGSMKMLSDNFFVKRINGKKVANQNFASDLLNWNLQLKSVLRLTKLEHHRDGETQPPITYVINEHLVIFFFSIPKKLQIY